MKNRYCKTRNLAVELGKRIILAWDPDDTRLISVENSGYLDDDEMDWNNLAKYE